LSEYPRLIRLSTDTTIKPFDCGHSELNGFLFENALEHTKELLAVTYLFEDEESTIAYFSVANDSIRISDAPSKGWFRRKILKSLPHEKRIKYSSYPAVKVGRFGVNEKYRRHGIGTELMDWIKGYFLEKNKTGCRFITVDAYEESLGFYEKNGFDYLTDADKGDETRLMHFDLIRFSGV